MEIEKITGDFNCVIMNINESISQKNETEITEIFLKSIDHVKKGGFLFIPEFTYANISGGRKVVEGLIKTLKLRIEVPPCDFENIIIASKT